MKLRIALVFFVLLLVSTSTKAQQKDTYSVGILIDTSTSETDTLLVQLKNEIRSVVGEDATILFSDSHILANNFDLAKARENYNSLISNNEVDLILAFGVINNVVVSRQAQHAKPTILFGAVNSDLVDLDRDRENSGIDNFTFLISTQSFKRDLVTFQQLYDFEQVGIVVEDYAAENLDLEPSFRPILDSLGTSFTLIPYNSLADITSNLNGIDAVYLAGVFFLTDEEITELAGELITRGLPSFTASNTHDVELGILGTNQPDENIGQLFRRIALSVEAIVNGQNASELPLYIDVENRLTLNFNTAERVGVPLRYSLIASTSFVGDFKNVLSEKTYNLIEVMNEAKAQNLSLLAAQRDVELAGQDVRTANSNFLPNITAGVTGTYIDPKVAQISNGQNPEYSTAGNITLTQTIYSAAAKANIDIQKELNEAQKENYNASELDAILNASSAYFVALIAKANTQITAQNLEITRRNLQIAQQNFDSGQSGKSDVLRFQSQLAQDTQTLVEAINQLEQSFYSLNQVLNYPIDREIDVVEADLEVGVFEDYKYDQFREFLDDPNLRKPFVKFLIQEAYKNSPELKSIEYSLKATDQSFKLANTGRFIPTLALQGQYNYTFNRSGAGTAFPPGFAAPPDGNYNLALNLSIPLFQQNQQNINRQIAVIQKNQLNINDQNIRLNIERNINDDVLAIINQVANIELSKVSEAAAKESLELTQISYSNGAVSLIQLLDAQNNYLNAQLARATAVYNYLLNSIQLERSIGYYFLMNSDEKNQEFTQRFLEFLSNNN